LLGFYNFGMFVKVRITGGYGFWNDISEERGGFVVIAVVRGAG
jgi:hypothetical protein